MMFNYTHSKYTLTAVALLALAFAITTGCSSGDSVNCWNLAGDDYDKNMKSSQFCYNQVIYEKCGGKSYNPEKQSCCGGDVVKKSVSCSAHLCGNYNQITQFCVDGSLYDKCGGKTYRPADEFCEKGIITGSCGGTNYNVETHFCSSVGVIEKCGNLPYDPSYDACCGISIYNKTQKICSDGVLVELCDGEPYNMETHFCTNKKIAEYCGSTRRTYNPSTQICIDGVVMGLCGDAHYDLVTQFCYDDVVGERCNETEGLVNSYHDPRLYACCGTGTYSLSNESCEDGVVLSKCGTGESFYNPKNEFCLENTVYSYCNGETYSNVARCENNSVQLKCGSVWYDPSSKYCLDGSVESKGTFTDARDGKTYRTVKIGEQLWMAENLNYSGVSNNTGVCNYEIANCDKYGRLYNVQDTASVCPAGWHLPSGDEWETLIAYIGNDLSVAGKHLKAANSWNINGNYGNGQDTYGFTALPSGNGTSDDGFNLPGYFIYLWSSTKSYFYMSFRNDVALLEALQINNEGDLYSVRCLSD